MKKALALMFVVMLTLGMLTACTTSTPAVTGADASTQAEPSTPAETVSATPSSIRCAYLTTAIPVPCFYAEEQGWYKDLGVELNISTFASGPAANESVGSGEIDIATLGAMPAILGGIAYNYKVIGWLEDDDFALQMYARNDSDVVTAGKGNIAGHEEIYGTAESWKGKNIIVTSATSAHYAVCSILAAIGLDESDVNLIDMDGASGAAAFLAGEGDMYAAWDPQYNAFSSDPDHYTRIGTCADSGNSFICVLAATEEYCTNNHDEIVKFLEGMVRACDTFSKDDQTYYDAMYRWQRTYTETDEATSTTSAMLRKMYDVTGMKAWHETDANGNSKLATAMYSIADFMIDRGLIEASDKQMLIDNGFIDSSFMLEAIENVDAAG